MQGQIGNISDGSLHYDQLAHLLQQEQHQLHEYDVWIINKVNDVVTLTAKYYDKFMLGEAFQEIITFVWHDFCDWYVEIVK